MAHWQRDDRSDAVHKRMIVVCSVFLLGLCAVLGRVYYLQVVEQSALLERQVRVERDITYTPRRGSILERNGRELAISVKAPSLFAHPRQLQGLEPTVTALAPLLGMPPDELRKKLDPKRRFVWVRRQISPALADTIASLKLPGIHLTQEYKRYYPQQDLAGQIVGFVGIDGNGLEGIERALEKELAGDTRQIKGRRDASGHYMLTGEMPPIESFEGHSVHLTLDEHIQRVAQKELTSQVKKFQAKGGYAVAIDVKTGEILAMANTPSFDPNRFRTSKSKAWRLRPITDTFEPGSVVKPLVLAAALQEGTVNLRTSFDCEKGRIKIGRYSIRDSHAHDLLSAAEVVQVSSNICAYKMAQTIGRDKLHGYFKAFGFGARSGLGMRGEQPGLVWPPDRWAEVTFANVAFGQGFSATPLQVVSAIAALGNDGMLMRPHLVKQIVARDGSIVREVKPELVRQVVSPAVAKDAARAMTLVTQSGGTAPQASMKDFHVAGKTGTAQKVNPKTRRYDSHMWVASFVGFFPAERPEVAIAVMIDEPQQSHYGGTVAAPVFKSIAQATAHVRGIFPVPADQQFAFETDPAVAKEDALDAEASEKAAALTAAEMAKKEAQETEDRLARTQAIAKARAAGAQIVPDFIGLTARQALLATKGLGKPPRVHGWGRVVSQTPAPGEAWTPQSTIELELLPPTEESLMAQEPSDGLK